MLESTTLLVRDLGRLALGVIVVFAFAISAIAQVPAGVISGRVIDESGRPVPEATVRIEGTSLRTHTDESGRFELRGVRLGSQSLLVERQGFETLRSAVNLAENVPAVSELVLHASPVPLGGVTIIGSREDLAEVRQSMRQIPGSVALLEAEKIRGTRQANFKDVLKYTPGVWVQPRFGAADESQLSIRGTGLRNNYHLRGVNLLVNGMPYRNADGFTDFEALELATVENMQVYKCSNALRYGGSTLGGAINLETKTGYTANSIDALTQGGSYGFAKAQAASGAVLGSTDYYLSYTHTRLDGYRDYSGQLRHRANVHLGHRFSEAIDARFFYFYARVEEDLPGTLTKEQFETNPRQASAGNVANKWGRDFDLHHIGLQLRTQISEHQRIDIAPYMQHRDIVHPIFQVIDQISRDFGVEARYENTAKLAGQDNRLTLGFQQAWGNIDNRRYVNQGGESGALTKDQRDEASTVALYAENALAIAARTKAIVGLRLDHTVRQSADNFLSDGDQSDKREFDAFMPKLGMIHELTSINAQIYANASRCVEPPLTSELNSLTVPGYIELEPQEAWQFEIGTRGVYKNSRWDVSAYDLEIKNEILNKNVQPFPNAPFTVPTYYNAAKTRHYGLETGLEYHSAAFATSLGQSVYGGRTAVTIAHHEFVEHDQGQGHHIPGAPSLVINTEIFYQHPSGLTLKPNLEWVPGDYYVNTENTDKNQGWAVLGLRAEFELRTLRGVLFVEGSNLTDELYSGSVSVDNAAKTYYEPADGRAVVFGFRWSL